MVTVTQLHEDAWMHIRVHLASVCHLARASPGLLQMHRAVLHKEHMEHARILPVLQRLQSRVDLYEFDDDPELTEIGRLAREVSRATTPLDELVTKLRRGVKRKTAVGPGPEELGRYIGELEPIKSKTSVNVILFLFHVYLST